MTSGDRAAYRALPPSQRRAVRRATRRGRRAQVDPGLADALLGFARRRQGRARGALAVAVVLILASAAAAVWVFLRVGPGPVLAAPVGGLFVGGVAGVLSEARLRRAEEAEALAEHHVRRRAAPPRAPGSSGSPPATEDPAGERLARILSGTHVVRTERDASGHPWG